MKFLNFIRCYWYIPLFVLVVIFSWMLFRRKKSPLAKIKTELAAIDAARKTKEIILKRGADAAKSHIQGEYKKALEALDEKKKIQAEELRNDPEALSKFLVRAGSDYKSGDTD